MTFLKITQQNNNWANFANKNQLTQLKQQANNKPMYAKYANILCEKYSNIENILNF